MGHRLRFGGWIAGIGTTSGTRLVLGHWPGSPFGPVSDVMMEDPAGRRTLLATSAELAEFVAATYGFDGVRVVPVEVRRAGSAGNGRYECTEPATCPIVAASAELDGRDLGTLTPIDPPVKFGFGSTPREPSLVRITTTVAVP